MLFGDGAAALIVSSDVGIDSIEILDVFLATDGSFVDDLGVRCPGTEFGARNVSPTDFSPRMAGQSVILNASRRMTAACKHLLEKHQLESREIRWVVPHQANANLLAQVARALKIPSENVVSVLENYGNTSSASMGIALDVLRRTHKIRAGDYVLMPAFGAGFMWGGALCRAL
jgi:3-oxoacyl-[acyl-carrier-protein] synthase-3